MIFRKSKFSLSFITHSRSLCAPSMCAHQVLCHQQTEGRRRWRGELELPPFHSSKTMLILMKFLMDEFTFFTRAPRARGGIITVWCIHHTWWQKSKQNMYLIIVQHSSNWWNNHWMCLFRSSQFTSDSVLAFLAEDWWWGMIKVRGWRFTYRSFASWKAEEHIGAVSVWHLTKDVEKFGWMSRLKRKQKKVLIKVSINKTNFHCQTQRSNDDVVMEIMRHDGKNKNNFWSFRPSTRICLHFHSDSECFRTWGKKF